MSTSNTSTPLDQNGFDPRVAAELREKRKNTIQKSLAKRHRKETTFRIFGFSAVVIGLLFVALLFGSILAKGLPAFWQTSMTVPVYFDPTLIDAGPKPVQASGETPAHFQERYIEWQTKMGMVDWDALIVNGLIAKDPSLASKRDDLSSLYTSSEAYRLRDMVFKDPSLIGKREDIKFLADANVDVWLTGKIDRSLPDDQQQLSPEVRQLADQLDKNGVLTHSFNTNIFTNPDSRSSPATSGLAGAFMGSLFMMMIVIFISIPIGVASAVYLEEFAKQNVITDVIEVNINNLAAVPSIVFGLLGAAIFINWMHLPLSAPLVGGLVLSLMTLPTVIITTRAALKAVPPSIRQAALGLGASRVQVVFHHVLPLALPGILTGAIIGVAQALGETAPLLLIGMSAFVASIPTSPLDQSTALPVQIFLWQGNELRNFFEGRTAAAIIVLLAMMIGLNSLAIWLRKKIRSALVIEGEMMNTIDTTNALEKDKTVTSDQMQFTGADTEQKRQTSFVSQFDTQTNPKKETKHKVKLSANDVHVYYGDSEAIKGIDISIYENEVIAFIGPSGCGKSTFLRTLNRMNDTIDSCRVTGKVLLDNHDIYDPNLDVVLLRAQVGMVFQKPNPFPKSIFDNVAYGPKLHGLARDKYDLEEIVENSLRKAGLWEEVKDRLNQPGTGLSGGQQQRLCIARTIAVSPEVILMDEPCSALDPIATAKVEELISELSTQYTIAIVTHSMQQAARVSDRTAYFHLGDLIEVNSTEKVFTQPDHQLTEAYITGRFG